jgi:ketosteroid isomerase-like protein
MIARLDLLTLCGLLALAAPALAAQPTSVAANKAAILKIEQDMAAAQTAEQAMATWDKNVVFDDMLPGEVVGYDAVRKDLAAQFAAVSSVDTRILRIDIEADNHLAWAFSTQHLVAPGKNGGPGLDLVFRESDGFVKKGGKWVLMHQHVSVPFDPKTGKAVFDTK